MVLDLFTIFVSAFKWKSGRGEGRLFTNKNGLFTKDVEGLFWFTTAHLIFEVAFDADASGSATVALGVVDTYGVGLFLDHFARSTKQYEQQITASLGRDCV